MDTNAQFVKIKLLKKKFGQIETNIARSTYAKFAFQKYGFNFLGFGFWGLKFNP